MPPAFLSPNKEIALSTRFCRFLKHTIFPNVYIKDTSKSSENDSLEDSKSESYVEVKNMVFMINGEPSNFLKAFAMEHSGSTKRNINSSSIYIDFGKDINVPFAETVVDRISVGIVVSQRLA